MSGEKDVSFRALLLTWIALMVLAGTSFVLRYAHLGPFSVVAAIGIALVKAVLVVLVFMELAFEPPSVRIAFASAIVLVALLGGLMVADVLTRAPPPLPSPPGTALRTRG